MKQYLKADKISLVYSGNNYFELLEDMIDQAKEIVHIQTYIFETDATGLRIVEAIKRASARGVTVYVLIDAFGSLSFSKEIEMELKDSGVNFRRFAPLFSSESIYFGRRLHHKIIVCDKTIALTGGINIADKYNETQKEKPWLDYAVLTKGDVCQYLHLLCEQHYKKVKPGILRNWEKNTQQKLSEPAALIRFRRNDWIKRKNEIHKSYVEELIKAKTCVTIVASYFLPGLAFRKLLAEASRRGVKINILLAGKSDVGTVRLAESYLYDFYLRNKIDLYEWTNSVMHGKAMIVDNRWATVGSYNLNFLSHYISIELNTDVIDASFVGEFSEHLHHITNNFCRKVDLETPFKKKQWFTQLKMWLAYNFFRTLMNLTVARKRKRN
jgi:cardiolipin synthase